MMDNASATAAFRGGKESPDAATTSSAERPPPLIACKRSFAVGFNLVAFILLLLVLIIALAFMMVVDNRNGECQLIATLLLGSCDYDYKMQTRRSSTRNRSTSLSPSAFYDVLTLSSYRWPVSPPKARICTMQSSMYPNRHPNTLPLRHRGDGSCSTVPTHRNSGLSSVADHGHRPSTAQELAYERQDKPRNPAVLNALRELDFHRMLVSFPSLMARVRRFTVPLPTQVSSIRSVPLRLTRCLYINRQPYVGGVACYVSPTLVPSPLPDGASAMAET